MLAKTLEDIEPKVTDVVDKMSIYLENSTTQSILLKPVSKKISKGLEEIKKSANGMTGGNSGWDESMREEVVGIIMTLFHIRHVEAFFFVSNKNRTYYWICTRYL